MNKVIRTWKLIISDNGKGMDKVTLEQLRKKVFQVNNNDLCKK